MADLAVPKQHEPAVRAQPFGDGQRAVHGAQGGFPIRIQRRGAGDGLAGGGKGALHPLLFRLKGMIVLLHKQGGAYGKKQCEGDGEHRQIVFLPQFHRVSSSPESR